MQTRQTRLLSALLAIPPLLATSACATRATPPIADNICLSFAAIRYAIPPVQPDGTRDMTDDPGNRHDTTETVRDVQEHNARFDAVCAVR